LGKRIIKECEKRKEGAKSTMILMEENALTGNINDLGELELLNVSGTDEETLWNEMIRKYHYLGLGKMIGPRVKYLIVHNGAAIGAIGFNRASKSVGVRERYISDGTIRNG
jgi:hypothetical protein